MAYYLESEKEYDRLEKQSESDLYDYKAELSGFQFPKTGTVLDAGCGSGIVSRYIADSYPNLNVVGLDFSSQRVEQAKADERNSKNLSFEEGSVLQLPFEDSSMDAIVCRYVLHHLGVEKAKKACQEFYRVLKPKGRVILIDIDGLFYNLYPQTPLYQKFLAGIDQLEADLFMGRKLSTLLSESGYGSITQTIRFQEFNKSNKPLESNLLQERLSQLESSGLMEKIFKNAHEVDQFKSEFLEIMRQETSNLFYLFFSTAAVKNTVTLIKKNKL